MTRRSVVGLLSGLVVVGAAAVVEVEAQAPAEGQRVYVPSRRVPMYFGQVGLTTSQREEIYSIRARYYEQISDLKRQIEELEEKEDGECLAVLTDSQRSLLESLRGARRGGVRAPAPEPAEPPKPAPAEPPKPAPTEPPKPEKPDERPKTKGA
jgi:hypothetical protein